MMSYQIAVKKKKKKKSSKNMRVLLHEVSIKIYWHTIKLNITTTIPKV